MVKTHELVVSANDAERLALMLGERRRQSAHEALAADALADLLLEARLVPHERLPANRVAMNTTVTYQEEPRGGRRSIVLAHPAEADASRGRISVLSPVGRALLGRLAGSAVVVDLPGAKRTLRILEVTHDGEQRAA